MITFKHKGDFSNTEKFFNNAMKRNYLHILHKYGQEGVNALALATPIDSGKTSSSWYYEIIQKKNGCKIVWSNSHIVDGIPIAILLQYGHGTRNGSYVEGKDFINPALKTVFDNMARDAWEEVTRG